MTTGTIHVIGAGIAGLSAATALAEHGYRVRLYERANHAGGRCRSFYDDQMCRVIDNGNHLILKGNTSIHGYVERIGSSDHLETLPRAAFPFLDMATGARWCFDLGAGNTSWQTAFRLLCKGYGIPGCSRRDLLSAFQFRDSSETASVQKKLGEAGVIYERLWEPLSLAVLNTEPERAMAAAMWPVLRETLGQGADACRPVMAKQGLSPALIDPGLTYLERQGGVVRFGTALNAVNIAEQLVRALVFSDGSVDLDPDDKVVFALPIAAVNALLPEIETPADYRPILNAHFRLPGRSISELTMIGLINSHVHWIFRRGDMASVTISAAMEWVDEPIDRVADRLWQEVVVALKLTDTPMEAFRVIKEKRATFAQTPEQNRLRPSAETRFSNLFLAGDWTATGLPATIEGAVRSGEIVRDKIRKMV